MTVERRKGAYIPTGAGEKRIPYVGPGVPVWAVIAALHAYHWDVDRVASEWAGYLTAEDVMAAAEFYRNDPVEIDRKLRANADLSDSWPLST
jgi:uncharacterized protein (DUF433 family)